jgi:hypothetical protein
MLILTGIRLQSIYLQPVEIKLTCIIQDLISTDYFSYWLSELSSASSAVASSVGRRSPNAA